MYVNVENILEMLQGQKPDEDLFVGDIIINAKPIRRRSSKYYVPEFIYGVGLYPTYAGGGGFVMSGHTALRLSSACQQVYTQSVGHLVSFWIDNSFTYNFFFTFRSSCSQLMMSFLECASSWLASNHLATRAFEPSESLDHLPHRTFRHSIPVSTGNLWLFTA